MKVKIALTVDLERLPGEKKDEQEWRRRKFEKKIRAYADFLKDDWDWDWNPIVRLLGFKLRRTRDAIANGHAADRAKRAKQVDAVISLLDRICEEDYHKAVFKEFYQKHGEPKMVEGPVELHKGQKVYPLEFIYANGKPADEGMHREMRRLCRKEDRMQQRDINKAFLLLAKHIRSWWD
jgi:hypothetical protein